MKNKNDLSESKLWYIIGLMFGLILCFGLSWLITCGIIKLITLCFGLTFKWSIATGIWLVLCLLRGSFNMTVKK